MNINIILQYELAKKEVIMETNVGLIEKRGANKASVAEEESKEEKHNSMSRSSIATIVVKYSTL